MTTTPTTTTTTPPSTPILYGPLNVEYLNESWCELQYKSGCSSTGSISHLNHSVNPEILEKLLQEAQRDSSQRQSPTLPLLVPPPPLPEPSSSLSSSSSTSHHHHQQQSIKSTAAAAAASAAAAAASAAAASNRTKQSHCVVESLETTLKAGGDTESSIGVTQPILINSQCSGGGVGGGGASGSETTKSTLVKKSAIVSASTATFSDLYYEQIDDDDVDLEYVEGDDDDEDNHTNVVDENGEMSSYGTIRHRVRSCAKHKNELGDGVKCVGGVEADGPQSASTPCPNCMKQKKQIDALIERQLKNEKELIRMRNEYEVKLLNKSLEWTTTTGSGSGSGGKAITQSESSGSGYMARSAMTSKSSSGVNTPLQQQQQQQYQTQTAPVLSQQQQQPSQPTADWVKYFASRPQTQPPNSKSKYANFECPPQSSITITTSALVDSSKLLSRENIGKLIFTHMASFIVGATLGI